MKRALVLFALSSAACAAGCADDGGGTTASPASEALLESMDFGDGMKVDGEGAPSTRSDVVITPVVQTVIVSPGTSNVLAIDIDNPDEDSDPVVVTQVELQTDKGHFEVGVQGKTLGGQQRTGDAGVPDAGTEPAAAGAQIRIENHFEVAQGVCKNLCNTFHSVEVHESAVLGGGEVGARALRQLVLDCSGAGDPARCHDGEEALRCALRYTPGAGTCEVELYFCDDGVNRALQCDGSTCDCVQRLADGTTVVEETQVVDDPAAHCAELDGATESVRLQAYDSACPGGATFD